MTRKSSVEFLNKLIGKPLLYAIKSPDTELYDFGFGTVVETTNWQGKRKRIGTLTIHALCRFKVIWRNGVRRVEKYFEDSPAEKFHSDIQCLVGLKIRRIALSDKNDLWIDFGDFWVVFATFENGEESWRFFTSDTDAPHLVASDSWLHFSD